MRVIGARAASALIWGISPSTSENSFSSSVASVSSSFLISSLGRRLGQLLDQLSGRPFRYLPQLVSARSRGSALGRICPYSCSVPGSTWESQASSPSKANRISVCDKLSKYSQAMKGFRESRVRLDKERESIKRRS